MPQGLGQLSHIGIGKESTFGTPVAATDYFKFTSESLTPSIEELVSAGISDIRDEPESFEGLGTVAGDLVTEVRPEAIGFLLNSWFNSISSVQEGATAAYKHTFIPTNTPFSDECIVKPFTLEIARDLGSDRAWQLAGCASNILNFSFGTGEKILNLTTSIIGKSHGFITATTPSFETAEPFRWNQATINIDGSDSSHLESLGMTLDNGLVGVPLLNNTKVIGKIMGDAFRMGTITPTFDIESTNIDRYDNFIGFVTKPWIITFTGANIEGAFDYELKITLPKVLYTAFPIAVGGPGRLIVGASGKIKYDSASGFLAKIELTNTKTSY